eukprot:scaffold75401_cov33-Tisochrysis_lutea.AAC.3
MCVYRNRSNTAASESKAVAAAARTAWSAARACIARTKRFLAAKIPHASMARKLPFRRARRKLLLQRLSSALRVLCPLPTPGWQGTLEPRCAFAACPERVYRVLCIQVDGGRECASTQRIGAKEIVPPRCSGGCSPTSYATLSATRSRRRGTKIGWRSSSSQRKPAPLFAIDPARQREANAQERAGVPASGMTIEQGCTLGGVLAAPGASVATGSK